MLFKSTDSAHMTSMRETCMIDIDVQHLTSTDREMIIHKNSKVGLKIEQACMPNTYCY